MTQCCQLASRTEGVAGEAPGGAPLSVPGPAWRCPSGCGGAEGGTRPTWRAARSPFISAPTRVFHERLAARPGAPGGCSSSPTPSRSPSCSGTSSGAATSPLVEGVRLQHGRLRPKPSRGRLGQPPAFAYRLHYGPAAAPSHSAAGSASTAPATPRSATSSTTTSAGAPTCSAGPSRKSATSHDKEQR